MKLTTMLSLLLAALLIASVGVAQEEMTKDQWQQQINDLTAQRNDLSARVKALTDQVTSMESQSAKLDDDYKKCLDALYGLVGSNAGEADAFRKEIDDAENSANELSRLSDADLMSRSEDVDSLVDAVRSDGGRDRFDFRAVIVERGRRGEAVPDLRGSGWHQHGLALDFAHGGLRRFRRTVARDRPQAPSTGHQFLGTLLRPARRAALSRFVREVSDPCNLFRFRLRRRVLSRCRQGYSSPRLRSWRARLPARRLGAGRRGE